MNISVNPDTIDNFHLKKMHLNRFESSRCLPELAIHHFTVLASYQKIQNTRVIDEAYNTSYYYKIMMSSWWKAREDASKHNRESMFTNFFFWSIFFFAFYSSQNPTRVNSGSNDCWLKVEDRIMVITGCKFFYFFVKKKNFNHVWAEINFCRNETRILPWSSSCGGNNIISFMACFR